MWDYNNTYYILFLIIILLLSKLKLDDSFLLRMQKKTITIKVKCFVYTDVKHQFKIFFVS